MCYIGFVDQTLVVEARTVREGAALTDRGMRGLLVARGNDRQTFLHNMLSNAIAGLTPGQGCRADCLLDDCGHVVADFRVHVLDGEVQLDCETPAFAAKAFAALDKFIIMDDVQLADASVGTFVLTLSGPKAAEVLRAAGAAELPSAPYSSVTSQIAGRTALVVASPWTGRGDFDIHFTEAARDLVRSALVAAGAKAISVATFEAMRIEAGVTQQTTELDDVLALEAEPRSRGDLLHEGLLSRPGGDGAHRRTRPREPPARRYHARRRRAGNPRRHAPRGRQGRRPHHLVGVLSDARQAHRARGPPPNTRRPAPRSS